MYIINHIFSIDSFLVYLYNTVSLLVLTFLPNISYYSFLPNILNTVTKWDECF